MLHLIYIFAFTIIAFLTISNLIRSLITVSMNSQRPYSNRTNMYGSKGAPHPELLDDKGIPINEPLLVMRSVSVEDARQQLDALYKASPSQTIDVDEEK
ncbi:DUF2973 domain-containing protein [Aphanothece hegewaldii CCALA 016]|uniref:DUF2973 domain-containing protein n=1 Tax=Aphanothece hegewaldii CCALA 016 TaxID=2107694 RepID=A0A2T1M190_9CHRO|nr:DUF2973 domain-containing protein [Aphanothece hegewaldii]PSF38446.1 DUF2973 domain-containing protein [Aphanothece hegewaldii CCALA 016]